MPMKSPPRKVKQQGRPPAAHGYPRPQLERAQWTSLDGPWDFAIDRDGVLTRPDQVDFERTITVPFSPETPASGIADTSFYRAVWYRRTVTVPTPPPDRRTILHFGAVDYAASVFVNGHLAATHEGGYTPFHADVTDLLSDGGEQTIHVLANDDPHDLAKPRGKQDWRLDPHSIWYPRTTGIWQAVWLETVHQHHIAKLHWKPDAETWTISFAVRVAGPRAAPGTVTDESQSLRLRVRLTARGHILADDTYLVDPGTLEVHRSVALSDPGIDDFRNELLWSPHSPTLIDAELTLLDAGNRPLDAARSYTALRQTALLGNKFVLNGKPYPLMLVLDQGYWPDTGLTAPDDGAFRRDVELVKSMGFNGVRKHQKIEDPRFLYWADRLGLLVWEEMPSPYRFTDDSIRRHVGQWMEAIDRDLSHPCVIAWVPFNESWGVPDLPHSPAQRDAVRGAYHLTRTLDPSRPVIGNDGWEAVATDIVGIHDYDHDPDRLARRYDGSDPSLSNLFKNERPGHKVLLLDDFTYAGQPIMLTEFGGIAFSKDIAATWGYSRARTAEDFAARYAALLRTVRSLPLLAGFCYTQFTDTYQEANGLLYMDRTPKFPLDQIAIATRGPRSPQEEKVDATWRERLMSGQRS